MFTYVITFQITKLSQRAKFIKIMSHVRFYHLNGLTHEPPQDKTNKMACVPSEDSDQSGHPPSLISVFAVRMMKAWTLSYQLSVQQRL